jgi:hypothetical protein
MITSLNLVQSASALQNLRVDSTGAAIEGGVRREFVAADAAVGNPSYVGSAFAVVSGSKYRYRLVLNSTQATGSKTISTGFFDAVTATVSRHTRVGLAVGGASPVQAALSDTDLTAHLDFAFDAAVLSVSVEGSFVCTASGTVRARIASAASMTALAGSYFEIEKVG